VNPVAGTHRHLLLALGRRSGLPFELLHGEPLYAHAVRALAEVPGRLVVQVDKPDLERVREDMDCWRIPATVVAGAEWWDLVVHAPGAGLVVHDPLCPLVKAEFVISLMRSAHEQPAVSFVAVRPVTDTLKAVVDGKITGTIDREALATVTSPILVASEVISRESQEPPPPVHDFAEMVGWLRHRGVVELVRAPSLARRVEHARTVHLLECVDEVARRVRA
jgi:hypothetical protein